MKSRQFNLRSEASYYFNPDCQHKWRVQGNKSWIINYHHGERFNAWQPHNGVTKEDMLKRKDWIKLTAVEFKTKLPDLPL